MVAETDQLSEEEAANKDKNSAASRKIRRTFVRVTRKHPNLFTTYLCFVYFPASFILPLTRLIDFLPFDITSGV